MAVQQSPFYRVHEVARILGCSEGAVRQRIARKQIPVTRIGESVLVPRDDFDQLVRELLLSARR
jgi:excisionase family DNA binding protein